MKILLYWDSKTKDRIHFMAVNHSKSDPVIG